MLSLIPLQEIYSSLTGCSHLLETLRGGWYFFCIILWASLILIRRVHTYRRQVTRPLSPSVCSTNSSVVIAQVFNHPAELRSRVLKGWLWKLMSKSILQKMTKIQYTPDPLLWCNKAVKLAFNLCWWMLQVITQKVCCCLFKLLSLYDCTSSSIGLSAIVTDIIQMDFKLRIHIILDTYSI